MINKRIKSSSIIGFISVERKSFKDYELFSSKKDAFYTISKLKLWLGTPREFNSKIKGKKILGIQCEYTDIFTGDKIISDSHCGELTNEDTKLYELKLENNDYIKKFYLNFDYYITYLKILTKKGKYIELGEFNEEYNKYIEINFESKPHMINCFFGYYNKYGLCALGFQYLSRTNFILFSMLEIFKLRHILKTNEAERKRWENPENLKKISLKMQAIVKLCNLENILFNRIIQYYFSY